MDHRLLGSPGLRIGVGGMLCFYNFHRRAEERNLRLGDETDGPTEVSLLTLVMLLSNKSGAVNVVLI